MGVVALGARRPVLADRQLDRALRRDGFVVVRMISALAAADLRRAFGRLNGWERREHIAEQPPDFEIAMWDRRPEFQQELIATIRAATDGAVDSMFLHHRPSARSILVRWPTEEGDRSWDGVPDAFHADAAFVDEHRGHRAYRVWLALQDTTTDNGCVHVVPHSHRLDTAVRGWGIEPSWLGHLDVLERHSIAMPLRAGEALVFDPALVHRSRPNRSTEPRAAVSLLLTEPDAALCIYRARPDGRADVVPIDDEAFADGSYNDVATRPAAGVVPVGGRRLTARSVDTRLSALAARDRLAASGRRRRRRSRRLPTSTPDPASLLAAIGSDGYTVVDLLSPAEVRAARAVVEQSGVATAEPFFASVASAWGPEARSTDQRLRRIVTPAAGRLLPGHRPFLASITFKGARSTRTIEYHQDWTYTDERRWRAVFMWCPLVDVDHDNGALEVVPGSHLWSNHLRPSRDYEPSEELQAELASAAVELPLAAGQAVVFDPATFHGSGWNTTGRARPAITVALAPLEASLVHFHEDADGLLSGYTVDERFFTEHPYRTRPDGYEPVEPYAPALTAATLAAAIAHHGIG